MHNFYYKVGYCNGQLKPGTMYRFKVRAYTTREKHSETNWSQPIQTDPDNTAFLVGIIIPIVLIILVVIAVLTARRSVFVFFSDLKFVQYLL